MTLWLRQETELNSEPPHDFISGPGAMVPMEEPRKKQRTAGDQPAGLQHASGQQKGCVADVLICTGSHQPWEAECTLS